MASHVRVFLVTDAAVRHLSRRLVQELWNGAPVLPEYAGTRQRLAEVYIEFRDKKPQRVIDMRGFWYGFDERGALVSDDAGRASLKWPISERHRKLVYAAIFGRNVIPLSSGKPAR